MTAAYRLTKKKSLFFSSTTFPMVKNTFVLQKSAAKAAIADLARSGISNAADGLVHGVVDNFDADISSQMESSLPTRLLSFSHST